MGCGCGMRRVEVVEDSTASAGFTAETIVETISATLSTGRTYWVLGYQHIASGTDNDLAIMRIRQDDILGGIVQQVYHRIEGAGNTSRGFVPWVMGRHVATATGSKTFVYTAQLVTGTGNLFREGSGAEPNYMIIDQQLNA